MWNAVSSRAALRRAYVANEALVFSLDRSRRASRISCALVAALALSAANVARAQETPWTGDRGITETVEQIMERERFAEPAQLPRPAGPRLVPARQNLPQAAGAPASATFPVTNLPPVAPPVVAPPIPGHGGGPNSPQAVGTSFLGVQLSESGFIPPDSCGSVGPTQVLACANGRIKVFSKTGTLGGLNAGLDSFFNSVRNGSGVSDPQVKYDRTSGRWFVTAVNVASTNNRVLLAVSSGSTITNSASFTFFFFQQNLAPPAGDTGLFADYPKTGVDANAIYVGANMFGPSSFNGATGFVIRKSSVTSGGPLVVTAFRGLIASGGAGAGPFAPTGVDNDDPAATQGYFVGVNNNSFGQLVLRRVSNPGGTPTISGNLNVTVPTTVFPQAQPALGSTHTLDALDDRLFSAQIHKNRISGVTSLWTAHNIEVNSAGTASGSGNRNGSRWYQLGNLSTTPSLTQSGTLFDSAATNPRGFWIPSCAMSGQGHMALASSYAGNNDRAGIAAAGRLSSDASGTIQAPTLAVTSATNYNVESSSPQRWGDFSATAVDPTDDQTIWTFQEYCNGTNSWGVRVIQLRAPPPAMPTSASPSSLQQGQSNVNVMITGTSSAGSAFYDTEPGVNRIAASFSGSGITVNSITFTSGTQITLNVNVSAGATLGARTLTVTNPDGQMATSASGIVTVTSGFPDCNGNGIPDSTDISNGTSQDCDGNGVPDECQPDSDGDGTINACDGCPNDPNKIAPGVCGCGVADTDSDGDGTPNCNDLCPNDPNKTAPGACGCGVADTDSDGDGTPNCNDGCPNDPNKTSPGACGCGVLDVDSDLDGVPDCIDGCPSDPNKVAPGACGCGVADTDSDGDGTPDCNDGCPNDPTKTAPGICGCGIADTDTDGDGAPDCVDACPTDPAKVAPGVCGCGTPDVDSDGDLVFDCLDNCPGTSNTGQEDADADGFGDACDNCPAEANPGQEDCDSNGVGDVCEISGGTQPDCDANGIPDNCEPDCNANGVADACDISSGTSTDLNGNGVPDECDPPCPAISTYCTAKVNSAGCTPFMNWSGTPSASAGSGFLVTGEQVLATHAGLLFYSINGPGGGPFQGGHLCATPPTKRTPIQTSSAAGVPPCTGIHSFDFNVRIASGIDPALVSGQQVWSQYWTRDAGAASGTGLTNGLTFTICP